jgi:hypothetical protein
MSCDLVSFLALFVWRRAETRGGLSRSADWKSAVSSRPLGSSLLPVIDKTTKAFAQLGASQHEAFFRSLLRHSLPCTRLFFSAAPRSPGTSLSASFLLALSRARSARFGSPIWPERGLDFFDFPKRFFTFMD